LPFASYAAATPFLPVINKLGTETLSRMVESIRLYREIPDARLIVSGGIVRQKDGPIANLMAEFTTTMGVPRQDIVVEGRSTTTSENLLEVKKLSAPRLSLSSHHLAIFDARLPWPASWG